MENLNEYEKVRVMVIVREFIIRTIIIIPIIIIVLFFLKNINGKIKTEIIQGTVIETTVREEENIFSFLGLVDKYKWKHN